MGYGAAHPTRRCVPTVVVHLATDDGFGDAIAGPGWADDNGWGDYDKLFYLLDDVTSVGYQLRDPRRVAIVGAGGGRDILTAKLAGAELVDAIELNAGIVSAV